MKVEVLHIADCPGWQQAGANARRALDTLGMHDVELTYRLITSAEDARSSRFGGSPTILIDGHDAFASSDRAGALSCRLYPTPEGLRDSPTVAQVIEAIRAALSDAGSKA